MAPHHPHAQEEPETQCIKQGAGAGGHLDEGGLQEVVLYMGKGTAHVVASAPS